MLLKLGRKAPVWYVKDMRAAHRAAAALAPLGAPPDTSADFTSAVTALVGKDWCVFLNDRLGDCTAASSAHTFLLRRANAGQWLMPTDNDVLALYEATGGYDPNDPSTDRGANEDDVCEYLRDVGFLGDRSSGTAPVATGLIDDAACDRIKWTTQLFGSCRLGVNMPNNAEDQFNAGQPWTISDHNAAIAGGHDVPVVGYNPMFLTVVTWGRLQQVTWSWLKKYGEEAHAELWPDFLMSGSGLSPAGFDMATLTQNLAALNVA